jgi:CheY-like chemotaxis protein
VAPQAIEPRRPHAASLAILCAEDGSTNQIILRELLGEMGHVITLAEDGRAALDALAANDYDLVIMDGRMPRMDGIAALQRLRAGLDGVRDPALRVIALTANATVEERQRFLAAGANGFLAKPIDEAALHAEIGRQLEVLLAQGRPLVGAGAPHRAPATDTPTLDELDAMFGVADLPATVPRPGPAPIAADKLYDAVRAAFVIEGPRLLAAATQALADGEALALALAAHSLMGAAAFLGADDVCAVCAQIEKLADTGQLDAVPPHLAALRQELDRTLATMTPTVAA